MLCTRSLIGPFASCYTLVVAGASEQVVNSADEMMSCLDAGSAGRHFGTTNMNEHSSRSHSIFTVYIGKYFSIHSTLLLLGNYLNYLTVARDYVEPQ